MAIRRRKTSRRKITCSPRRKSIRTSRRKRPVMARRRRRTYTRTRRVVRRARRSTSRGLGRIRNVFSGGLIGNGTKALGASVTTQVVASRFGLGQHSVLAGAGAGYLAGGLAGMAVGEAIKRIAGIPSVFDYLGGFSFLSGGNGNNGGSV